MRPGPQWRNDKLNLGRLGVVQIHYGAFVWWTLTPVGGARCRVDDGRYTDDVACKRAVRRWLRVALKQAGKRLGLP